MVTVGCKGEGTAATDLKLSRVSTLSYAVASTRGHTFLKEGNTFDRNISYGLKLTVRNF